MLWFYFCIDIVKQFAISLKENMNTFYYGSQGFLLDIGLGYSSGYIYNNAKECGIYSVSSFCHKWLYRIDRIRIIKGLWIIIVKRMLPSRKDCKGSFVTAVIIFVQDILFFEALYLP